MPLCGKELRPLLRGSALILSNGLPLLRGSANASHLRMRTPVVEGRSHTRMRKPVDEGRSHLRMRKPVDEGRSHLRMRKPVDEGRSHLRMRTRLMESGRPHPEVRGQSPSLEGRGRHVATYPHVEISCLPRRNMAFLRAQRGEKIHARPEHVG